MPLPPLSEFDGASCAVTLIRAEAELVRRALCVFAHSLDEPYRARVAALALRFRAVARQPEEVQP